MINARLLAEIISLVRQAGRVPADIPIGAETRLVEDLQINSLDLVSLVVRLQDDYGVDVADDDLPLLVRVSDVVSYVHARVNKVAAA